MFVKMTKTFVQHYVENLLKVLKALKTRTALTRNGLAEFRCAPHGRALKRHQTKGAKPGYKRRLQLYYKTKKSFKKLLTSDIIESEKERRIKMRKPRLSKSTIERLLNGEKVEKGKYEYEVTRDWDNDLQTYIDRLTRWDWENNTYEDWEIPASEGLWEFEK